MVLYLFNPFNRDLNHTKHKYSITLKKERQERLRVLTRKPKYFKAGKQELTTTAAAPSSSTNCRPRRKIYIEEGGWLVSYPATRSEVAPPFRLGTASLDVF